MLDGIQLPLLSHALSVVSNVQLSDLPPKLLTWPTPSSRPSSSKPHSFQAGEFPRNQAGYSLENPYWD
jgi:hypothetical protein